MILKDAARMDSGPQVGMSVVQRQRDYPWPSWTAARGVSNAARGHGLWLFSLMGSAAVKSQALSLSELLGAHRLAAEGEIQALSGGIASQRKPEVGGSDTE